MGNVLSRCSLICVGSEEAEQLLVQSKKRNAKCCRRVMGLQIGPIKSEDLACIPSAAVYLLCSWTSCGSTLKHSSCLLNGPSSMTHPEVP